MTPKLLCRLMGIVFIVVAIWGFVDGHQVLIFHVNTAHNIVHLLSGLGALACGFAAPKVARAFCITFGIVYGLVAVAGFMGFGQVISFLHINPADNWLHTAISLVFLVVGLMPTLATPRRTAVA